MKRKTNMSYVLCLTTTFSLTLEKKIIGLSEFVPVFEVGVTVHQFAMHNTN